MARSLKKGPFVDQKLLKKTKKLKAGTKEVITKSVVRLALSIMYGIAESTVSDREWVARRVGKELRKEFPQITYSYWRPITQAGDDMADRLAQVLEFIEAYKKMPTVAQVFGWNSDESRIQYVHTMRRRRNCRSTY